MSNFISQPQPLSGAQSVSYSYANIDGRSGMQYISDSMGQVYANRYLQYLRQPEYTNTYNYIPVNMEKVDRSFSGVGENLILKPDIQMNYPTPYNHGRCVRPKERNDTVYFDLHKRPSFSSLTDGFQLGSREQDLRFTNQL